MALSVQLSGQLDLTVRRSGGRVSPVAREIETVSSAEPNCLNKLAELFPAASPVRIPVRVTSMSAGRRRLQEQTLIEFGTPQEVMFSSSLPLEFEDRVRIVNSDGSLDVRAEVVAVRYHAGRKAIAARFLGAVENWIIKP